jgi:hypothetical protein
MARFGWQRERGAAAVVIVLLLGSGTLLGVGALVVDVGRIYVEREQLQSDADPSCYYAKLGTRLTG